MSNYFYFRGNNYGKGTIVKIYEEHKEKFKFYSNLIFEKYDKESGLYLFKSPYNHWEIFNISKNQIEEYIEEVVKPCCVAQVDMSTKVNPDYIEGMSSAWIWYILIMFFGLFLKGPINVVSTWVLASIVFFTWRHKKINGE